MSLAIFPKRWPRWDGGPVPPCGVQLNGGHALMPGLFGCWLFNVGAGSVIPNLVPGGASVLWTAGPTTTTYDWNPGGLKTFTVAGNVRGLIGGSGSAQLPTLGNGVNFSWDCLFRYDGNDTYGTLFTHGLAGGMYIHTSSGAKFDYFASSVDHHSTVSLTAGQIYHLAITAESTTIRMYINGALDNTFTSISGTFAPDTMFNDTSSENISGLFALQRLWIGRVLTPTELLDLYLDPFGMVTAQAPVRRLRSVTPAQLSGHIGALVGGDHWLRAALLNAGMVS